MIGDTCLSADAALTFNYSDGSTALKKCLLLPRKEDWTDFVMDALNYTFFYVIVGKLVWLIRNMFLQVLAFA